MPWSDDDSSCSFPRFSDYEQLPTPPASDDAVTSWPELPDLADLGVDLSLFDPALFAGQLEHDPEPRLFPDDDDAALIGDLEADLPLLTADDLDLFL